MRSVRTMRSVRRSISVGLAVFVVLTGALLLAGVPAFALKGIEVGAPTVQSESAVGVTPFDAGLEARITANNQFTEYHFEYADNEALTGAITLGAGTLPGGAAEERVPYSAPSAPPSPAAPPVDLGGALTPATAYYYRVVASNASGTTKGPVQKFTTPAAEKPGLETGSVSVSGQSGVKFTGQVNPEFQEVTACEFQYVDEAAFNATGFAGPHASLPCVSLPGGIGSGGAGVSVKALGEALQPNTAYYYRLVAVNATGETASAPERLPTANTGQASAVSTTEATIAGAVNPGASGPGPETSYYFQYGTSTSYTSQIPLAAVGVGQSASAVPETAALSGLQPDTIYYYRIVASSGNAVAYGEGKTFTTSATPPVLGPLTAGGVTQTTATFTTTINAQDLATNYELLLGTTPGSLSFPAAGGSFRGSAAEPLTINLEWLTPGTVYYYKLVAVNSDGTVASPEASFTTAASTVVVQVTPPIPIVFPSGKLEANETHTSGTTEPQEPAKHKQRTKKPKPKTCTKGSKKQRASCKKKGGKRGKR
jgi:hypothetical protein